MLDYKIIIIYFLPQICIGILKFSNIILSQTLGVYLLIIMGSKVKCLYSNSNVYKVIKEIKAGNLSANKL